jgi:hypothetical protein
MALAEPAMLDVLLDDLVGPPLPPVAARAWEVFSHVSGTRSSGMGGIGAITYTELLAYQTLTGTTLTPLDVALVREADQAFLSFALTRMKSAGDRPEDTDEPGE